MDNFNSKLTQHGEFTIEFKMMACHNNYHHHY